MARSSEVNQKTGLVLRPYQEDVLNQLNTYLEQGDRDIVIAASPSSGKTTMVSEFIKRNPNKRFLILAHGTTIIKNQWGDVLKGYGIECTDVPSKEAKVIYTLPQSHRKLDDVGKIDFLIIDEAHEFTFAKTSKGIVRDIDPKVKIYLTGTPSKFILENSKISSEDYKNGKSPNPPYKMIFIAATTVAKAGFINDLYFGLFSSKVNLTDDDLNKHGNLLESGEKKLEVTVDEDLKSALKAITVRLTATDYVKKRPNLAKILDKTKLNKWSTILKALHKTMFACASVNQAKQVKEYFDKQGIKTVISTYENDVDSDKITEFKTDDEVRVLVVCQRGTLGFDMPFLVNVVDMTGSKDANRVYQLFARAMRKNGKYDLKYFFKLAPVGQVEVTQFWMQAAMTLMFEDFLRRFNGKNLKSAVVVAMRVEKEKNKRKGRGGGHQDPTVFAPIDAFFYGKVTAMELLTELYNKSDDDVSEKAFATLGEIMSRNYGEAAEKEDLSTKEKILALLIRRRNEKNT